MTLSPYHHQLSASVATSTNLTSLFDTFWPGIRFKYNMWVTLFGQACASNTICGDGSPCEAIKTLLGCLVQSGRPAGARGHRRVLPWRVLCGHGWGPGTSETVGFPRLEKAFVRAQTLGWCRTAQLLSKWLHTRALKTMRNMVLPPDDRTA